MRHNHEGVTRCDRDAAIEGLPIQGSCRYTFTLQDKQTGRLERIRGSRFQTC